MLRILKIIIILVVSLSLVQQIYFKPAIKHQIETIYKYALDVGVMYPDVYVAQVIHETGWFTSNVFKDHNNLNGMMCNRSHLCKCDKSNRSDVDGTYCHYSSIYDSIDNYKEWQTKRLSEYTQYYPLPSSQEEYLVFLNNLVLGKSKGHRYATDPHYTKKLRLRLKQVKYLNYLPFIM